MTLRRYISIQALLACSLSFAACAHTETFPTGPLLPLGPINENNAILTFNPSDDYAPTWTPDGQYVMYTYSDPTLASTTDSRCIAMVPALGGTRIFTLCDTRSTHADSSESFSAVSLRSDGKLLFVQSSGNRKTTPASRTTNLWLVDTIAPLGARHLLATFPHQIGDSVVDNFGDAAWIDSTTFIAIGQRITLPPDPIRTLYRDTLPKPLYLVRGKLSGETVTLTQIPGTEFAAHWARTPDGSILFVRGTLDAAGLSVVEDPTIMRVPELGGTAEIFANIPNGRPVRAITCAAGSCLALSTVLYRMDPVSRNFALISPGSISTFTAWTNMALSPDGSTLIYRSTTPVSNPICFCTRRTGNIFRVGVPAQ